VRGQFVPSSSAIPAKVSCSDSQSCGRSVSSSCTLSRRCPWSRVYGQKYTRVVQKVGRLIYVDVINFVEFNCASRTRGHHFKLYKCHSYSSVRASYFANRVIRQIILTFRLLLHLKERFSRLTCQRFYYVIRLSFSVLLSVSLVAL